MKYFEVFEYSSAVDRAPFRKPFGTLKIIEHEWTPPGPSTSWPKSAAEEFQRSQPLLRTMNTYATRYTACLLRCPPTEARRIYQQSLHILSLWTYATAYQYVYFDSCTYCCSWKLFIPSRWQRVDERVTIVNTSSPLYLNNGNVTIYGNL